MAKLTGTGVSGSDIFCTARVKSYPGGRCEALVCDKAIFGGSGWEARQGARVKESRAKDGGHDVARAVRRARAQVRDIALCTPFRWFVTLTLDPAGEPLRCPGGHTAPQPLAGQPGQAEGPGLRPGAGAAQGRGYPLPRLLQRRAGGQGQRNCLSARPESPQEAQERPPAGKMAGGRGETRL